jgi:hypothetical protein
MSNVRSFPSKGRAINKYSTPEHIILLNTNVTCVTLLKIVTLIYILVDKAANYTSYSHHNIE